MNGTINILNLKITVTSIILFTISVFFSILLGYLLTINGNQFTFTTISVLLILMMTMYLYFKPNQAISVFFLLINNPINILYLVGIIIVIYFSVHFYYEYYSKNGEIYLTTNYFLDIFLLSLIIVLGLTLIFVKYRNSIDLKTGNNGVLFQILFFIPCLITDLIEWIRGEMKITPSSVFIILLIEIILIIIFFNISSIMSWISNRDPINHIMPEPVFLNEELKVMSAEKFNGLTQDGSGNKISKPNYFLGYWVYINDNMKSDALQLPVLCYGGGQLLDSSLVYNKNPYGSYNVHPSVVFLPKKQENNVYAGDLDNINIGHLGIYFSNVENPVIIDFPLQRWNFLAFNCTSTMVDVFLNGKIVYTEYFNGNSMPIYHGSDYITIGGNNLQGSIKDIMYCDYTLSSTAIVSIYNMNMFSSKLIPSYILQ